MVIIFFPIFYAHNHLNSIFYTINIKTTNIVSVTSSKIFEEFI